MGPAESSWGERKAAGASEIVGEMLKAGNDQVVKKLTQFIKRVWREETIPEDRKGGIVIPLYSGTPIQDESQ